jgi:hypothetical protein
VKTQKAQVDRNGIGTAVAFFIDLMLIVEKVYIFILQMNTFFLSELSLLSYSFVGVGKFH